MIWLSVSHASPNVSSVTCFHGCGLAARALQIKRLRLMAEDIAHCALRTYETNRERVGLVVARRRHRQTYRDAGAHIEFPRRQHQQGMYVLHLPPDLRTAVDPDHVTATRTPRQAPSHQSSSAPMRYVAITSPP